MAELEAFEVQRKSIESIIERIQNTGAQRQTALQKRQKAAQELEKLYP